MKYIYVSGILLLSACSADTEDLQDWATQQQQQASQVVLEAMPSAPIIPDYQAPELTHTYHAFDARRVQLSAPKANNGQVPDMNRQRGVLEGFALDRLAFVGVFKQGKRVAAYVQAEDYVYRVQLGDYIGQNHGKLTAIHADRLVLSEWVEDAQGMWLEREAVLPLHRAQSETNSSSKTKQSNHE